VGRPLGVVRIVLRIGGAIAIVVRAVLRVVMLSVVLLLRVVVLWIVVLRIGLLRILRRIGMPIGRLVVAGGLAPIGLAVAVGRERIALPDQARELGQRIGRGVGIASVSIVLIVAVAARILVIRHQLP